MSDYCGCCDARDYEPRDHSVGLSQRDYASLRQLEGMVAFQQRLLKRMAYLEETLDAKDEEIRRLKADYRRYCDTPCDYCGEGGDPDSEYNAHNKS